MHNPTQLSSRFHPSAPVLHALACAALLLAGGAARASDDVYPAWDFSGFASLGVAHSDYDQADFISNILKSEGTGATHNWNGNLDSRLGAQAGVKFDKQWSAVVQLGVEQRYDLGYRPLVEWANVKYQATPDLALRVGRIALPLFLVADYRKVGYAYPWVRTPNELYGGIPITNSDGADIAYRWQSGRVKHTTQAYYGITSVHLTKTTGLKARGMSGVTHTAEWGPATVRVSAFTTVLDLNVVRDLFDGFRLFGAAGVAIADNYAVASKRTNGVTIGVNYDPGQWFLMAEGGRTKSRSFLGDNVGMYASAGYRSGAFTPYLSYARNKPKSRVDPGLSLAGLPPPYAYAAAQLNANLDVLLKSTASQTNVGAGVRWDFRPDMALKLQYEHLTPRDGTRGTLTKLQPGFVSGHPVNVTSAVLDVVF